MAVTIFNLIMVRNIIFCACVIDLEVILAKHLLLQSDAFELMCGWMTGIYIHIPRQITSFH